MADFFLSNLKSTLDNCITELDEIYCFHHKKLYLNDIDKYIVINYFS